MTRICALRKYFVIGGHHLCVCGRPAGGGLAWTVRIAGLPFLVSHTWRAINQISVTSDTAQPVCLDCDNTFDPI
eukprot:1741416-Amphidinium_carterae.1